MSVVLTDVPGTNRAALTSAKDGPDPAGSLNKAVGGTLLDVSKMPPARRPRKRKHRKCPKPRRNPICLAIAWQQQLDGGVVRARAELARKLGVSRARVTQVLNLLKPPPVVQGGFVAAGDPSGLRSTQRGRGTA